jgi:hypothetical protein
VVGLVRRRLRGPLWLAQGLLEDAMLGMNKLSIAELERAAAGK